MHGNTARKIKEEDFYKVHPRKTSCSARRNREKADNFGLFPMLIFAILMSVIAFFLVNYLRLQSDLLTIQKRVEASELYYYRLKNDNDNTQERLETSVSFEEIKERAINELGMDYPREDQIIYFSCDDDDYVKQYKDVE